MHNSVAWFWTYKISDSAKYQDNQITLVQFDVKIN